MIRSPEDLLLAYEAEKSEADAVQVREELMQLLAQPGWTRFQQWLSDRRDYAFQQLRQVQGDTRSVAESFWKWQQIDALYEDIEHFIHQAIDQGNDIIRRQTELLQESFLREELYGRSNPGTSPAGTSASPESPASGPADSY